MDWLQLLEDLVVGELVASSGDYIRIEPIDAFVSLEAVGIVPMSTMSGNTRGLGNEDLENWGQQLDRFALLMTASEGKPIDKSYC